MSRLPLRHIAALFVVLWAGAALRWTNVGKLPPGLYRDEAFYGIDATHLLAGDLSVFFVANNGREALFIYALAPSIAVLGRTPEALRWTASLFGVLTLAAVYAAGRAMFSPRLGLLAAAVIAVTFWHLALSRTAFRAITLPPALAVTMAAWFLARRAHDPLRRYRWAALAGGAFGLTFYTYAAAPLIVPLMLPLVVRESRHDWRVGMSFGAAALAVLFPFGAWTLRHAPLLLTRPTQVSILSEGDAAPWLALAENALRALGMFFVAGDTIWRHNLPGRPVFDPALAIGFVLGLYVAARRGTTASRALLAWLALFLLPTLLAVDAPHFLRAVGALPAAGLLAALGLDALRQSTTDALIQRRLAPHHAAALGWVVALVPLLFGGVKTFRDYFGDYVHRPLTAYWFEAQEVVLGHTINHALEQQQRVLLDRRLMSDSPTLRFIAPAADYVGDMGLYFEFPMRAERGVLLVDPNHDWTALRNALPSPAQLSLTLGPMAQNDRDPEPRRAFVAVSFAPAPARAASWRLGNAVELLEANLAQDASDAHTSIVTLAWRARQPVVDDLAVFVHALQDGRLIAQADSTPGQGYLPTYFWRPGDVIRDRYVLRLPASASSVTIAVGMYRRADLQRLPVFTAQGELQGDSVIIPTR